jgi:hypothetical protein
MSDGMILGVAIAVFSLLIIGLVLTVMEYRRTIYPLDERDNDSDS